VFRFVGGKDVTQVNASVLFVEIEARAARLHLSSPRNGNPAQGAFDFSEIFENRTDRTVLVDEFPDDVVERLERLGVSANHPITVEYNIVSGAGLRLSSRGELVLLTHRGDVVDLHLDVVLGTPFVAERRQRVVGAGDPMVHGAKRERSGRVGALDVRRRNRGDCTKRCGFQHAAASKPRKVLSLDG
jgi:hypothetical protein